MRIIKEKSAILLLLVILVAFTNGEVTRAETTPDDALLVPIVAYHRVVEKPTNVLDVTPKRLKEHFQFFKESGYTPITASQLLNWRDNPAAFPPKPLVITFDDGPLSNYTQVFPLLKKYDWAATFFIYPKVITENSKTQLTWGQLREMAAAGMDIQSHTLTHPFLTDKKAAGALRYSKWLKQELRESRRILQEQLRREVNLIAYPYGFYNSYVEKQCRRAGYRGMFTINYGINLIERGRIRFDRYIMENTLSVAVLRSFLTAIPLKIKVIKPRDGRRVTRLREVKFRIENIELKQVEVKFCRRRLRLESDSRGVFAFDWIPEAPSGYQMVIVKFQGPNGENYLGNFGFDYQPPGKR
jgi:peptidoglycan/xylan/chitin deacetylase (PgdA/CDA1 family)